MKLWKVPDPKRWRKGGLPRGRRALGERGEQHGPARILFSRDYPMIEGSLQCQYCKAGYRDADIRYGKCPNCKMLVKG